MNDNNTNNNGNMNYNNQNGNYDNNYYTPQNTMYNYTPQDAEKDKKHKNLGIVFLVIGIFFAGIIFGSCAIAKSAQIKQKSTSKTVILVLGIVEIILTVMGIVANAFLNIA